ncbi:MAG: putative ATP-dependent RNA helicase dhr2 [Bogoriella megaspora]|nr:MAG: putative ATP-dependent RNA helicase dhr2 [Bogoriella megaspora]
MINGKKRKRDNDELSKSIPTEDVMQESASGRTPIPQNGQLQNTKSKLQPNKPQKKSDNKLSLSAKAKFLLPTRQKLPIWPHRTSIRTALDKDVLILVGETGSGKSTQLPQFLLDCPWLADRRIAITQPRRVAAISLARRVADELGTPCGSSSPASKVGYSVRFDVSVSPNTKVKFLTEGMLLQELLRDPLLKEYGCVVVDEVHERSVNVDLILGFLRGIVVSGERERGQRLKIVVMSATAEMEKLEKFFDEGFREAEMKGDIALDGDEQIDGHQEEDETVSWNGFSSEDEENEVEEAIESAERISKSTDGDSKSTNNAIERHNGFHSPQNQAEKPLNSKGKHIESQAPQESQHVSTIYVQGRQYPVQTFYLSSPTDDFLEAALTQIFLCHQHEPMPGDILVFLTGQDQVETLKSLIENHASTLPSRSPALPKITALPIFAALTPAQQAAALRPAPKGTRKVILATNIAETSVTVPGVRYVIDCGKSKQKHFHNTLGLDTLLAKTISKSSAIQREGRAGREAPGKCWRLYTKDEYAKMERNTLPEILRCDLSQAVLMMKARGVRDVVGFPLLEQPSREAVEKALVHLLQLGALEEKDGVISEVGRRMARLPLTPSLGRVIVEAAKDEGKCLAEVVDIISALSVKDLFLDPRSDEKREEAEKARSELVRRQGDHLTLLSTVRAYDAEKTDKKAWAEKRLIGHRAMQNVINVRKQLRVHCGQQKLIRKGSISESTNGPAIVSDETAEAILRCFLQGFFMSTARLMPDQKYKTFIGNHELAIHPSSFMFGQKTDAIMFTEFTFTNKSYARGVSRVQVDWIGDALAPTEGGD